MPKLHNQIQVLFGIDLRSLAFFRVCLGLVLFADLISRSSDLAVHYTDWGLLPRGVLIDEFLNSWYISVHLISGKLWVQAVLFTIAACFALSLIVGYRTRLSTVVSWFFLVSLHARNPMVLLVGDNLLRMLLFWSMFVPLGASYSVDAALQTEPEQVPKSVFSAGTFALLAQVVILYVVSALQKVVRNGVMGQPFTMH